ncbi:hypothetical protein [Nocardioides marmorisolisilvae]|uniref:hypothetical protein n=1 Tax=Nocardioides marmorisolisilvae TaxID=1542737 RepID=UPI0011CE2CE5|nr:hypothetical protein [Nocardioides marmorisolisilvae]
MRLRSTSAAVALTAAATLTLTGCGSTQEPTADEPPTTGTTATGHSTPHSGPTKTSTPTPKSTPTQTEGDGDGEDDDTPATAGGGICGDLSAGEVGAVVGGTVKGAALPGGGCGFTQASAKAPSATFVEKSLAKTPGGMDGAKTEATSSVEGDPHDLSGIGDAAFVVTGTAFGEPAVQGAGAVRVGNRIISINLTQSAGMSASAVKAMTIKLLKLAASQA